MAARRVGEEKTDEEIARSLQQQFEKEEKERRVREERDRELAESIAKGTHTLSDSDSDITIDPNSPDRKEPSSDFDSDIAVDETGEAEITPQKHKSEGDIREKVQPPLHKKSTMSIEELFGSEDSDCDQASAKLLGKTTSSSSSRTISIHHVSDSDNSDNEMQPVNQRNKGNVASKVKVQNSTDKKEYEHKATMKRKHSSEHRQRCPYGMKCYRKNPSHFEEMIHPAGHANAIEEDRSSTSSTPDVKRRRTIENPNSLQNASPGCNISKRKSLTKDTQKTPSNPRTSVNTPKVQRQQTIPSTSNGSSTSKPTGAGTPSSTHRKAVTLSPSASCLKKNPPNEVYQESQPLSFLLTKVTGIEPQYNSSLAMHIKEILSPCMGNLKRSAQFNYKIDVPWLVQQYPPEFRMQPLLVIHGSQREEKREIESEVVAFNHIRLCQARLEIMFGTHHTKMMLLLYDNGMRVVIHTANLLHKDWYQKTQGIWISPVFPRLAQESAIEGDSETNFKKDLLEYLAAYRASQLNDWMKIIREHDMSSAKVHIIGSVPGRHAADKKTHFGHLKLRKVLEKNGPEPEFVKDWPVIGQFSSVGSLGNTKEVWLTSELLSSLSATARSSALSIGGGHKAKLNLIFPTKENVRQSLEGYAAGGSIPYSINVAKKQTYLHTFFHQWKSEVRGRSTAMPHIKTYTRVSPDSKKLAWFLVTSANMSKAAWGALEKNNSQLMIRSYEIGVLFIPKYFGDRHNTFEVMRNLGKIDSAGAEDDELVFPVPYDIPLTDYFKQDRPWIWDIPYVDKPDTHMTKWCPPLK